MYPRKKDPPRNFLQAIVGDTERQVESKRVQEAVASTDVEHDLRRALEVRESMLSLVTDSDHAIQSRGSTDGLGSLPFDDRSFDLINIANWDDNIIWEPRDEATKPAVSPQNDLAAPLNKVLESGAWTQSIIWGPREPFRDFTQLELQEQDVLPEERAGRGCLAEWLTFDSLCEQRKKLFVLGSACVPTRNQGTSTTSREISSTRYPKTAVDTASARHSVNWLWSMPTRHRNSSCLSCVHIQAITLCLSDFAVQYKTRLSKQEARSFHRPALQFPSNIEIHFSKVRTAKKKKDRAGRKVGKGGDIGEGLHRTGDLSLRDTSNFVLWEFCEEHPPIISNFGMGTILVNYYRKQNEKDDHVPKVHYSSSCTCVRLTLSRTIWESRSSSNLRTSLRS